MAPSARSQTPRAVPLLLAGASAAFLALALLVLGAPETLLAIDRPVTAAVTHGRGGLVAEVMSGASLIGSRAVMGGILLALTVWAIVTRECQRTVGVMLAAFVAVVVLESVLKPTIGRARPDVGFALAQVRTAAFPSGHALGAAAVYGLLPVVLDARWRGHLLAWVAIAIIGFSRIYLGVHWMSDVVAGMLLGLVVVAAGVIALRGHRLDPSRCPGGHAP